VDKVTPALVGAMSARYFVRDNRVVGLFIPEDRPQRAEIPATPSPAQALASFKPKAQGDQGEAFDPSQDNITRRSRVVNFGDLKIALLPKKNRGETVNVSMSFHWGDEKSLFNRSMAESLSMAMLARGTSKYTRRQLDDEMTRLKMTGGLTSFQTTRKHLSEALQLVAHVLKEANYPESEFEELKRQTLTGLESQLDNPDALSRDALAAHFNTYPEGDPRFHTPLAERIRQVKATTLDDARNYYREFLGTARGEIAVIGDFDAAAAEADLKQLFPDFASKAPWARVDREYRPVTAARKVIDTPDKENAYLRGRMEFPLRDDDPEAAALFAANYIFGGSSGLSNRLMARLRQKEGISYGVGASLGMSSREKLTTWSVGILSAPQNVARAEQAFREELERARRDGFTAAELAEAQKGIIQTRAITRSQDGALANGWTSNLDLGRTWQFSKDFEAKILALTPEQVNAAFRKFIDPAQLTLIVAGDAKKGVK
jgi:zinc protease